MGAGLVAMLVKPTTGALWVLPLLAYTAAAEASGWRAWLRARRNPVLVALVVVPFLAAMAWTRHADAVKGAGAATEWLTSARLTTWNFGTIHQRLVGANWSAVMKRIQLELTGYPAWLLAFAGLVGLRTRASRFWMAMAAVLLGSIVVFWNLYVVHDYYLAAVSPVPAALGGMAFARAWHALSRREAKELLAGLLGASILALPALDPTFATLAYRSFTVDTKLPEAVEAARLTRPTDLVVFEGFDWSPAVPYYARRSGHMIGADPNERLTAADLAADGYRIVVTKRLDSPLATGTVTAGRWTGVLGRFVYVTGETAADLRGAPIVATDDDVPTAGTNRLDAPVTIACGQPPVALPRAPGSTVLHIAPEAARTAKLTVAAGYGDLPVRSTIVVGPGLGDGPLLVSCRDAGSVTVDAVS